MATTRLALLQEVLRKLGQDAMGTATGGTTTTLIDTSADSPFTTADDSNLFKNQWLYIHTGTHAATERRVTTYTPSSQQLTIPAVTGAVDTTDQYLVAGVRWAQLVTALNRALTERLVYWTRSPLTLVADGDMETSGTSDWTASNATVTKNTSAGNVWGGTQALSVVTTAADGYARTTSINVNSNQTYTLQAMCRRATATGVPKLVVWDATNSAAISLSTTASTAQYDGFDWQRLTSTFTTPGSCRQVQVRLQDETTTATSYWDDVILLPRAHWIEAPSWLDEPWRMDWLWYPVGGAPPVPEQWEWVPVQNCRLEVDPPAVRDNRVWFTADGLGQPLYVSGFRSYTSLSTDAATTTAPPKWVHAATIAAYYESIVHSPRHADDRKLRAIWQQWAALAERYRRAYFRSHRWRPIRLPGE